VSVSFVSLPSSLTRGEGTLQRGETRLLFSSAQVDYMRYWLLANKLTENWIPLPYSDCLLTDSDLRTVGPIVFEDGGALRKATKVRSVSLECGNLIQSLDALYRR
jgi:hypothetical protein